MSAKTERLCAVIGCLIFAALLPFGSAHAALIYSQTINNPLATVSVLDDFSNCRDSQGCLGKPGLVFDAAQVNGDFELGPTIPSINPVMSVAPGSTALTGWSVTGGAIDIVTDNYWAPVSGHRSIALSSTGPGGIEQVLSTAPGAVYRLTYWISGEPFSSPTIKHLRVTAGATVSDQTFDITPAWE